MFGAEGEREEPIEALDLVGGLSNLVNEPTTEPWPTVGAVPGFAPHGGMVAFGALQADHGGGKPLTSRLDLPISHDEHPRNGACNCSGGRQVKMHGPGPCVRACALTDRRHESRGPFWRVRKRVR